MSKKIKPKIEYGNVHRKEGVIVVPVRFNFSDGTSYEATYNWNDAVTEFDIEDQLKNEYKNKYKMRQPKNPGDPDPVLEKVNRMKGKKLNKVTDFDDEVLIEEDVV